MKDKRRAKNVTTLTFYGDEPDFPSAEPKDNEQIYPSRGEGPAHGTGCGEDEKKRLKNIQPLRLNKIHTRSMDKIDPEEQFARFSASFLASCD